MAGYLSTSGELLCEVSRGVAVVTLNRPARRNALSISLQESIVGLVEELEVDDEVSVIVVTGSGDHAFCAGGDLKEMDELAKQGRPIPQPMRGSHRNVFEAVLESTKPTIAAINGFAIAGGLELALACDIRIAAETAQLGMPEARIGMGANFASVLLPRVISTSTAMGLLYTGDTVGAERALDIGLVSEVVPIAKLREHVLAYAARIAANAPLTLQRYKAMLVKGSSLPAAVALRLNAGPNPYTSEDRVEGIRAQLEKRPPVWRGR